MHRDQASSWRFMYAARWRPVLSLVGLGPRRSSVTLDGHTFRARLGWCTLRTPLTNIASVQRTGPYRPWRVFGIRGSLTDRGLTMGTNTDAGICVAFTTPVRARWVPWRPTSVTVTVADPDSLLRSLAGADRKRSR
ncbi:hypothetical protein AB0M43_36770 [Longispora sp. NPDC051575]|uniref:hypothetical protein n=1 Tax=Longispora sp. NPDC051575 TaxID=3154943 RepID=UPI003446A21C